ncbi:DEAD/DEAH box helicase [Clostridium malenominatum]|uniref:DEAD/DEAH box helicase n=1 Tax=Clostridium malenominatum TaxID=1539 RepID=A0ABP3TZ18_9CLOT
MNNTKFNELGLNEKILRAIEDMGFEEPSQIQAQVIPVVLEGFDVIGQAQTGTGKTLAFGAPMLNNLTRENNTIKGLILTPTRELAIQVNEELVRIAKHTNLRMLPVYGGQSIDRQIKAIKKGIDVVVGTPGRVLDLISRRVLDLDDIQFLVLDEADEMLNMGFVEDIEEIINNCNSYRHTLLFSATMPGPIKKIAQKYMKPDSKHVSILKNTMTVSTVEQYYYEVKQKDRFESFCRILDVDEPDTAIIFCKTKKGVDELVEAMLVRGYNVEGMHGDMNQSQRMNTLRKFKEDNLDFLVATDVAARGIDVENITHVINYDLPQDTESYVHRIGRTGRANKTGVAYTLVTAREYSVLKQIEKATKGKIKRKEIPTIDDIFNVKYSHMLEKVKETLEGEDYKRFVPIATELDDDYNLVDVAAALMNMVYDKEVSYDYTENSIGSSKSSHVRVFINVGRKDKLNPKTLLQFFNSEANVYKESIGSIDLLDKFSFVDIIEEDVDKVIRECSGKKLCGRRVNIEISNRSK